MNVEIGTETPIFLFWDYLFRNFGPLSLQCDIPAGDGKIGNPFLQCNCLPWHGCAEEFSFALAWRTYLGDVAMTMCP